VGEGGERGERWGEVGGGGERGERWGEVGGGGERWGEEREERGWWCKEQKEPVFPGGGRDGKEIITLFKTVRYEASKLDKTIKPDNTRANTRRDKTF
jgi:hypothetical protein